MTVRAHVLKAAMLGLTLGSAMAPTAASAKDDAKAEEKCYGINKCASHAKCGVSKSDVAATKADFGEKFAKTKTHDCAGTGSCAAAKGNLGWTMVAKGSCLKEGGFFIEGSGDAKKVKKS